MKHPIEEQGDKLLHLIDSDYYIEFIDGHLEWIAEATETQTNKLLEEMAVESHKAHKPD